MGSTNLVSPLSAVRGFFCINPRIPLQVTRTSFRNIKSKNPRISRCNFHILSRKRTPGGVMVSCSTKQTATVFEKVQRLDLEFKSLSEPIDRVRRLLHYAALLVPFDESSRIRENQVMGCSSQVWLDVQIDEYGLMRYRVDSDSEITKGFCSCLIWVLDGAEPHEVLCVRCEDLVEMNVGLPSGKSRVNAWYNVLKSMQKRTKDLVEERDVKNHCRDEALSSLIIVSGNCKETIVR